MSLLYPSREFDEAVAAVCHGTATEEQMRGLNVLLRADPAARDEYLLRVELHSRLASDPELFAGEDGAAPVVPDAAGSAGVLPFPDSRSQRAAWGTWVLAVAACLALLATGWWGHRFLQGSGSRGATSRAVAMLNRVVDARWEPGGTAPRLGAPLEPGVLRLRSGLAQVVFYSGARVVIEGPAEFRIVSPAEAECRSGRMMAEVPPQARGFRVHAARMDVTDLGTAFGLVVGGGQTEVHVFQGSVEVQATGVPKSQRLLSGTGAIAAEAGSMRMATADAAAFASLFDLQAKSAAAEARLYDRWRSASAWRNQDPSLLVHFDFEHATRTDWSLANVSEANETMPDATIVGCQWIDGRWPMKPAIEFRGVSDRIRLTVPGEYESMSLAAWVRVDGLDRQIQSLFMSDGFAGGTLHWSLREDGVLGLTVIGPEPGSYQIVTSPPVVTAAQLGTWMHVAAVVDGQAGRVVHYVNGVEVGRKRLLQPPPFRVDVAELGNWNARGFPGNDPFLIRNFSGAMDEFFLFGRALGADEIRDLYAEGRPQAGSGR